MKLKVRELTGVELDRAVAKCEGIRVSRDVQLPHGKLETSWDPVTRWENAGNIYSPSTDWALAGPIIDKGLIVLSPYGYSDEAWHATTLISFKHVTMYGDTPLIAAMRCYVASRLGEEIDDPKDTVY